MSAMSRLDQLASEIYGAKEFINLTDYSNFIIEPYIENITIEPFVKKSNEYYISIINDNNRYKIWRSVFKNKKIYLMDKFA